MSYCRWSSDSFRCDLYCYADTAGGYTTHVAAKRISDNAPREDYAAFESGDIDRYMTSHAVLMRYLENAPRTLIGLPHDGASFNDPDLPSFLDRVRFLKACGYRVPDGVLESIAEEIAEERDE